MANPTAGYHASSRILVSSTSESRKWKSVEEVKFVRGAKLRNSEETKNVEHSSQHENYR